MRYLMQKVVDNAADNDVLEDDRVDIMSALTIARDCCETGDVEQSLLFIQAVRALARFLGFRNELRARVDWGKSALDVARSLGDDVAIAELCASTIAWPLLQLGEYPAAKHYCLEGLEAAGRCGNSPAAVLWAGNAARSLFGIARDAEDIVTAQYWAEQAAEYARRCDDETLRRGVQLDFGYAALLRRDFTEAERLFCELQDLEERGNDHERIANRSGDVAMAIMNRALRSDDQAERTRLCEQARVKAERSLQLAEGINHAVLIAECDIFLATLARIRGDKEEYQRLTASGRHRFLELGILRKGRAEQFVTFPDPME